MKTIVDETANITANNDIHRRPKRQSSTIVQHYVEVIIVVDYAIFKRCMCFICKNFK